MVTGYTFDTFKTHLATMAVVAEDDDAFLDNLPSAIDSAELRIMQELDLLSTVSQLTGYATTALERQVVFPIADFITLQQINIITPAGVVVPDHGTRNACLPVTKEYLDNVYNSRTNADVPAAFAMINQNTIILGPWPDDVYYIELVATVRPASLSPDVTQTFISTYLPDLFFAAAMVYISGYQRNFGRASDDPQMAVSWESYYQTRKGSALTEENRKKFQAGGWTSMVPAVTATPTRG